MQCGFCTPGLLMATVTSSPATPTPRRTTCAKAWPTTCAVAPATTTSLRQSYWLRRAPGERHRDRGLRDRHRRLGAPRDPRRASRARRRPRRRGRRRPGAERLARAGDEADRRRRPARHTRPGQLPPPPLPVGDARPRAGRDAVRVAGRPVPGVGAHRRGDRGRRRAGRAGRARHLGVHDDHRPPLRLPARRRRPARGRDRRGRRRRGALPPLSRRHGPRGQPGRAAARLAGRGPRRDPHGLRRGDRPLPRPRARRDGARRSRADVTVLGDAELLRETAELARSRGVRLHTHLAETVEEDAYCLEHHGMRPLAYVETLGWTGDDVWLAHCVHLDDDDVRADGRHRHRGGPLPHLQRAPGRRHRPRPGAARGGGARRARRRRRGVERVRRGWRPSCAPPS